MYKQVVSDVKAKWELVQNYVMDIKRQRYEAEQETRRQERLQKQLEWSENMIARQRGEAGSDVDMDDDLDDNSVGDASGSDDAEDEDDDSEVMSQSDSDDGSEKSKADEEEGEMDQDSLAAYLAQREAEPPDKPAEQLGVMEETLEDTAIEDTTRGGEADVDISMTDTKPEIESRTEHHLLERSASGVEAQGLGTSATSSSQAQELVADGVAPAPPRRLRRSQSADPAKDVQDAEAALSSDESTNMDSEDYDSDEDMGESDEDESASEDEAGQSDASEKPATSSGLWALFSNDEKKAFGLPTPVTSAEDDNEQDDHENDQATPRADTAADEQALAGARHDSEEIKYDEVQETDVPHIEVLTSDHDAQANPKRLDSLIHQSRASTPASQAPSSTVAKQIVPQPTLLRGTLRSYQHAGVDWLASLYRNGTNGILADEMGLGKTIQTIALLAHLAEQHEIWESHLVIVPTSVILNWVTEFQKFLPGFRVLGYYGTTEERQIKRRGWVNDPHHEDREKRGYNVVITSYNVALKDINAIRNVQWHYLVLDEAHNIRNFNSQRFQVLIRLRTRARLLLTGTPLQNSLTELWSLLTFLTAGDDDPQHGSLEEFLSHWKEPVKEIFDRGVQSLSDEASRVVGQLHTSLRPFMLRRLKSEVEKDLPKKIERTVVCKLSKRQRQLYQDYMGLADTKARLTQGNAVTAGKVLLSLRRVCNHPDLFDPRPIQTSFAMEQSPLQPYSVKEKLVRHLLGHNVEVAPCLMLAANERRQRYAAKRSKQLSATATLLNQLDQLEKAALSSEYDLSTVAGCRVFQRLRQRVRRGWPHADHDARCSDHAIAPGEERAHV